MRIILLLLFLINTLTIVCQRNEKEEAICQPFLTSKHTSPLISTIKRNLNVDEEGEFACELVLQDRYLPIQIRFTIHEGLYMLAYRHINMGLQRQKTIIRHLRVLSEIMPKSFKYSFLSGLYSLDPNVAEPHNAIKPLYNALYGNASTDNTITKEDIYLARKEYAKALCAINNYTEALHEIYNNIIDFPYDFDNYNIYNDINKLLNNNVRTVTVAIMKILSKRSRKLSYV